MSELYDQLTDRLRAAGDWLAPLGLRLLLAHEFFTAGMNKFRVGSEAPGWFVNQEFAFPFGMLSANLNWMMVTWTEIVAGLALALGLFTRFFAVTLLVVTTVAIAAVHWPADWDSLGQLWQGYSVSRVMEDGEFRGNFRIPFLFLAMLLPLAFMGGGKLSLDQLLLVFTQRSDLIHDRVQDALAFALAALLLALISVYLIPSWGLVLFVLGALLLLRAWMVRSAR
ncbi:HvfX family Cu-binding RiPP maturation protein [Wenzhouxiangella marina]|uniref:Putative membrane protein n=1 Tax=Wenzhouxiangella marina TaxID=1579979 RepID=A0A0K0XTF0_9GAMM|nr:DoxX family protein [Wenzhouxiangella marina]AKS40963.1 Putative membrane protein [Wenzhouxiangella marina]MBB6087837.1 putative oxidoreductase [Wenzhouxiangella marina]